MNNKVQTEEFAKNPEPEVWIKCTVCQKDYKFADILKEEPLPPPRETTVEGYLLCPSCLDRKHCYYLTEQLRYMQVELKKSLDKWHATKSSHVWREYARKQKSFQTSFDNVQARFAKTLKKEETSESGD